MNGQVIARYNKQGSKLSPRILREGEDAKSVLEKMGFKETDGGWKNSLGYTAQICEAFASKRAAPVRL